MTYQCDKCDRFFDARDAIRVTETDRSEAWGNSAYHESTYLTCPHCGHDEISEVEPG